MTLDTNYHSVDNILNNFKGSITLNNTIKETTVTDLTAIEEDDPHIRFKYDNIYPKILNDGDLHPMLIWDDEFALRDATSITTVDGTDSISSINSLIVSIPIYNTYLQKVSGDLCSDEKQFNLFDMDFAAYFMDGTTVLYSLSMIKYKTYTGGTLLMTMYNDEGEFSNTDPSSTHYQKRYDRVPDWRIWPSKESGANFDGHVYYLFKLTDSTGGEFYQSIYPEEVIGTRDILHADGTIYQRTNNVLEVAFTDLKTDYSYPYYPHPSLSESILSWGILLYPLLQTNAFKKKFAQWRKDYVQVDLMFLFSKYGSAADPQTLGLKIYNDDIFLYFTKGTTLYVDLDIDNIETMSKNKDYFLNRGLCLEYQDPHDNMLQFSEANWSINSTNMEKFQYYDLNESLYNSSNYETVNGVRIHSSLDLDYNYANICKIQFSNLEERTDIKLYNLNLTLMRTLTATSTTYYNTNPILSSVRLDNNYYLTSKTRTDITNVDIDTSYLSTTKFLEDNLETTTMLTVELQAAYKELSDSLDVNIFLRKMTTTFSYVYIQFTNIVPVRYIQKFLQEDMVGAVINNTILSITQIDNNGGAISMNLLSPTPDDLVTSYVDDKDQDTYVYKLEGKEVIEINGIYNKEFIECYYADEYKDNTSVYMPSDVVLISGNKK